MKMKWNRAGNMSFGSGVVMTEVEANGVKFKVFAEKVDTEAVEAALSVIESGANENSVTDVFADILRGLYGHLDLKIPDEMFPEAELNRLIEAIRPKTKAAKK